MNMNIELSRDEGLHAALACLLCGVLQRLHAWEVVHLIIRDAVKVERQHICEALSCGLSGMDDGLMSR